MADAWLLIQQKYTVMEVVQCVSKDIKTAFLVFPNVFLQSVLARVDVCEI